MTTAATATTRDEQRRAVRDLIGQHLSNRKIAARVGVSEATVRRWRAEDAAPTQSSDAPATRTDAPPGATTHTLTITVDKELAYHLGLLAEAGLSAQAAIEKAVAFLSDAFAEAWDHGIYPRGNPPELRPRIKGDPFKPILPPGW